MNQSQNNFPVDIDATFNAIGYLNSLLAADPVAINNLLNHRVPCSKSLADHPTCQVGVEFETYQPATHRFTVGLLGIINGLMGVQNNFTGAIKAVVDTETGRVIEFVIDPQLLQE